MSILHLQGRYLPGETAEQWRGEGYCERMVMSPELLANLPSYTITSMVASKRLEKEKEDEANDSNNDVSGVGSACSYYNAWICLTHACILRASLISHQKFFCHFLGRTQFRVKMDNKSRLLEIMQKTRLEYENGDISFEEIDWSIRVSACKQVAGLT
jgi:hypothetical protein